MSRINRKLVLIFTLILLVGTSVMVLTINYNTNKRYKDYISQNDGKFIKSLAPQFRAYYTKTGSWEGVDSQLRLVHEHGRRMFNPPPLLLLDKNQQVVMNTQSLSVNQQNLEKIIKRSVVIKNGNNIVGYLFSGYMISPKLTEEESNFLLRVNIIVITTSVVILLISILTISILTRRITGPLIDLTTAAKRVESGDYHIRVEPKGRDEISELSHSFNSMITAIESNNRWRKQIIADSAHELRTPVTLIQGNLELMLEGIYKIERENLESIYQETQNLSNLIKDLQELSSAESGGITLHKRELPFTEFIESVTSSFKPELLKRSISLTVDNRSGVERYNGDESSLRRVFTNVLSNAVKYSSDHSSITIEIKKIDNRLDILIGDNGPGIPEEDLERVFERFYRTDQSRNSHTGGRGLGLAISRELVKLHNGRIYAEKSQSGARIRIELPL